MGDTPGREPWGLRWRASLGFVTLGEYSFLCVPPKLETKSWNSCNVWYFYSLRSCRGLEAHMGSETGILTDQLVYSLIIPVIPYQLEALGYGGIGAKVSWLLVAFVRSSIPLNCASPVYLC
jgi:hypothetical protein